MKKVWIEAIQNVEKTHDNPLCESLSRGLNKEVNGCRHLKRSATPSTSETIIQEKESTGPNTDSEPSTSFSKPYIGKAKETTVNKKIRKVQKSIKRYLDFSPTLNSSTQTDKGAPGLDMSTQTLLLSPDKGLDEKYFAYKMHAVHLMDKLTNVQVSKLRLKTHVLRKNLHIHRLREKVDDLREQKQMQKRNYKEKIFDLDKEKLELFKLITLESIEVIKSNLREKCSREGDEDSSSSSDDESDTA